MSKRETTMMRDSRNTIGGTHLQKFKMHSILGLNVRSITTPVYPSTPGTRITTIRSMS